MTRYAALLRGVNVGGRAVVEMADLRAVFVALGLADVETVIQSGNLVFGAKRAPVASRLEAALAEGLGRNFTVVVRSGGELASVVSDNPYPKAAPSTLHVGFAPSSLEHAASLVEGLGSLETETIRTHGADLYLHLPNGMGKAKLPGALDRRLGVPVTYRNWNTVTKLAAFTAG